MEPEDSLSRSYYRTTCPCPEPEKSIPRPPTILIEDPF
jgi:hypothetical protein